MVSWQIHGLKKGASGPGRMGADVARFIKQEHDDEHLDSAYELS
jgi:hypothetical protein